MKFLQIIFPPLFLFSAAGFSGYWLADSPEEKKGAASVNLPEKERRASKIHSVLQGKSPAAQDGKFGKTDYLRLVKKMEAGMSAREYEEEYARLQEYKPFPYGAGEFLMESWAVKYPEAGIRYLENDSSKSKEEKVRAISSFMHFWGQQSPRSVYDYYAENKRNLPEYSVCSAIKKWTETDPRAAWEGIASLDPKSQAVTLDSFFHAIKKGAPEDIAEYAGKLAMENFSEDYRSQNLLKKLTTSWLEIDQEGARKWMSSLPPSTQKAAEKTWFMYAARNNLPIDEDERKNLASAAHSWELPHTFELSSDRMTMMRWLIENKAVGEDGAGLSPFINNWMYKNPSEVELWINGLVEGPMRDSAIEAFSREPKPFGHEAQIDLVMSMGDEAKRKNALRNIAESWYSESPEKAEEWLNQSPFSSEERQDIIKKKEPINWGKTFFGRSN